MSGLRFSADTMNALIDADRRVAAIEANAAAYAASCAAIRAQTLPRGDRASPSFLQATEGLNAARIITRTPTFPQGAPT